MRTRSFATQEIDKQWFVVDVEGVPWDAQQPA